MCVCEREIQRISLELFTGAGVKGYILANLSHRLPNYELNCLLKGAALTSPSHSETLFPIQFLHRYHSTTAAGSHSTSPLPLALRSFCPEPWRG